MNSFASSYPTKREIGLVELRSHSCNMYVI